MKSLKILILIATFVATHSFSAQSSASSVTKAKKKVVTPPGTVQLEERLYFDQTEITNFNWIEYIYWIKNKYSDSSAQYKAALPDTLVWGTNNPLNSNYLRHPTYREFPVVGVSYDQAIAYCSWRSDRVNEYYFAKKNKLEYHFYKVDSTFCKIPVVYTFRLPTEEEWEKAAAAPFSKSTIRKQKGSFPYQLKHKNDSNNNEDYTAPVRSYWRNIYGIYHLIGNVAEMVSKKGTCKGGSWKNTEEEAQVAQSMKYTKPTNWIGFRCVCEVAE